jgi:zinc transport system substrate-binding protein
LVERIGAACPELIVVDASRGIKLLAAGEHEAHEDEAGQGDPHVWLSPPLLQVMAANVKDALCRADPDHAGEYRSNTAALVAELEALDARIAQRLAPFRGRRFYVFHPAYGYFADRYGLVQESVEVEGKSPASRQLQDFVRKAKADGVRTIFLQPRFDPHGAQAVAEEIGGEVVRIDPLAADVPASLTTMSEKIAASMGQK